MNRIYRRFLQYCDHRWTGVKSEIISESENLITCITKCNKMYFDNIHHIMNCMDNTIKYLKEYYSINGYAIIAEDSKNYAKIKFMVVKR